MESQETPLLRTSLAMQKKKKGQRITLTNTSFARKIGHKLTTKGN